MNQYLEQDKSGASPDNFMRIDRPGLTLWVQTSQNPRGLFHQDGLHEETWGVWGTSLYSLPDETALGSVGSSGRVRWAANYENLLILSGTTAYLYDGSTVTAVAMPDSREVVDIDVLNNYFILGCPDGRFYWIVPGASTVGLLGFATAESSPDGLVAVRTVGDEVFLLGQTNSEVWQTTGDSSAPFARAPGRNFPRGCMARDTALQFDNSLFWVGNDGNVYRYANIPTIISDNGLAQRIRQRTGELSACVVEADMHKHYVLKIPGQGSFGYDPSTQQWCEFSTYEKTEWAGGSSMQIADRWYVGSDISKRIWLYDPEAVTDDGLTIERICTGSVPLVGVPGRNDNCCVYAGGSEDYTLRVRWKDGQDDFPDMYDELEVRAPADSPAIYRLGMPAAPFRTFEVSILDPVKARISGALTNEAFR